MLNDIKDRLASRFIDYVVDGVFNTVFAPILALVGTFIVFVALQLMGEIYHGHIPVGHTILLVASALVCGSIAGWYLKATLSRNAANYKKQLELSTLDIFCRYEKGRIPDHVDVYRKLHSRRGRPVKRIPIVLGYYARSGYKDIAVRALDFGTIENIHPTRLNRLKFDFVFDNEIMPGDYGQMKYRIMVTNQKEEPPPYQMVRAYNGPIREARIRVRFAPNALPRRVWRAQWLEGVEGEPELLGEPLQPVNGSTYETIFRSLPGGLNIDYGLYWDW